MSVTGMIQWRGTKINPNGGSVDNTLNFMTLLANLAQKKAPEWDMTPSQAIIAALASLNGGGVAAEFGVYRQSNETSGNTWSVPRITPVHIELLTNEQPAIAEGDALPFE